jgi:signal transduction histidine kinase
VCKLSELVRIKEEYKYLAIEFIEGHFIFLCWKGADECVFKLYTILTDYYAHFNSTHEISLMSQNWEQIIDLVQIPIVLIGDSDQSLVHNRAFSNLNYPINRCLKLNDNDQITIDKNLYRVIVNQNRKEKPVYLFFPVDEFLVTKNKPSTEQLGIVSSSIAHELNNPLAGILAGIDVLGLEDIDEEYQEKLMEMKKGVLRCKNLVETFLGFSRIETSYAYQNNLTFEFQESIQQALDLIRFRLIENNILMDLKYEKRAKFLQKLNPYIISMLFYLIFGELITNFSHYNLVKRESSFKIDLVVEENGRSISLSMPKDVALSDKFLNSKLFIHLREVERLKFKQENSIFSLMFSS